MRMFAPHKVVKLIGVGFFLFFFTPSSFCETSLTRPSAITNPFIMSQVVHVLYQENDWVYVISEDNKEGFIPYSYCAQFGSQMAGLALNVKKKMPRGEASLQVHLCLSLRQRQRL